MHFEGGRKKNLGYKVSKKRTGGCDGVLTLQTVMDAGNGGSVEVLAWKQ